MIQLGLSSEGIPDVEIQKLDNGYVVPDESLSMIHRRNREVVRERVETAARADEVGYDYLFYSEHHFGVTGANLPNPIQSQIAAARRTDDIRLVQMANVLPWHDPARLAEAVGMLDIASDGRAEVGVTSGFGNREVSVLGQHWGHTTEGERREGVAYDEALEILTKAWTQPFFSHSGDLHSIPPSLTDWSDGHEHTYLSEVASASEPDAVFDTGEGVETIHSIPLFPHPVQDPHPQLWTPGPSPASAREAAKKGMNICCHLSNTSEVCELIDAYHTAAQEADWPDHHETLSGEPFDRGWDSERGRGVGVIVPVFNTDVASDDALDRYELGIEFGLSQNKSQLPPSEAHKIDIDADGLLDTVDAPLVGSTEEIVDSLVTFAQQCRCENLLLIGRFESWGLTHKEARTQMESFATEIAPQVEAEL